MSKKEDSFHKDTGYNVFDMGDVFWPGVVFLASKQYKATSVKFYLKRTGIAIGLITASIRNTVQAFNGGNPDGYNPTGDDLSYGTIIASTIGTSDFVQYEIMLRSGVSLLKRHYAIVLRAPSMNSITDYISIQGSQPGWDLALDLHGVDSINSGTTWNSRWANLAPFFEVWETKHQGSILLSKRLFKMVN